MTPIAICFRGCRRIPWHAGAGSRFAIGRLPERHWIVGYIKHVRNRIPGTSCVLAVWLAWPALMAQTAQDVPNAVAALEQQVQKHLQEQKPQLAIPLLREILSLDPKNLNAQANLGVLVFFQGT